MASQATLFGDILLVGDISTGVFRPFVPATFRIQFLHGIHNLSDRATSIAL
jgi:hypothetical protein